MKKTQEHSSDPKISKIQTMFLEIQNSSLGCRFCFVPTKLTGFCWPNMRIPEKDKVFSSTYYYLNIMAAVCLSICLFWVIKLSWPPKCTIECLCVIHSPICYPQSPFCSLRLQSEKSGFFFQARPNIKRGVLRGVTKRLTSLDLALRGDWLVGKRRIEIWGQQQILGGPPLFFLTSIVPSFSLAQGRATSRAEITLGICFVS